MNKKLKDSTQGELFWMLVVLAIFDQRKDRVMT
jgi:hypothetical protein